MVLEEKKAREELQRGKLRGFYYLYGEDSFKQEHFLEGLRSRLSEQGAVELEAHYGEELNPAELMDSFDTFSLFQSKKFIVVKNADAIPAKQQEALLKLLDRCSESDSPSTIAFFARKGDARTKFFQAMSKAGERCVLVKLDPAADWELQQWAGYFAKQEDKKISEAAKNLLVEWNGGGLAELKFAVERASLYAGNADEIDESHVEATSVRARPENVFAFTEALLAGRKAEALEKLHMLLGQREEPLQLLALLVKQYRWLLAILVWRAEGKSEQQISSGLKIFPAAARTLFPAAKRLGPYAVLSALSALVACDQALKSGRDPGGHALYQLVLELCS